MAFPADEHVPRVFLTALRSAGHEVEEAKAVFGEATDDERLLRYCASEARILITHDEKDFSGDVTERVDHPGVVIYTDANVLRDEPEAAVRTLERVSDHVPRAELRNEIVWLDEWRLD